MCVVSFLGSFYLIISDLILVWSNLIFCFVVVVFFCGVSWLLSGYGLFSFGLSAVYGGPYCCGVTSQSAQPQVLQKFCLIRRQRHSLPVWHLRRGADLCSVAVQCSQVLYQCCLLGLVLLVLGVVNLLG